MRAADCCVGVDVGGCACACAALCLRGGCAHSAHAAPAPVLRLRLHRTLPAPHSFLRCTLPGALVAQVNGKPKTNFEDVFGIVAILSACTVVSS